MPSQFPVLDNKPIDQWRVTELREELRSRKLSTKGLKEELVKRLNEAIQEEELENGEELGDDDAEHNKDSQNNSSEEDEDAAKEVNFKSISDQNADGDKANAPININNAMLGSGNHNDDEMENVGFARKDEQKAATTKELETRSSYNQNATHQSGMQVNDAETDQKYEDSKSSIEGSAVSQLEPSDQVSEIIQDFEFQVKYESNSTDSLSINEKNNFTDNLIADNLPLELEVVKQEVKQSSSHDYPTVGEHSCIIGNMQETDDSQLIDEQEAGKKIDFGQGIDKDIATYDGVGLKHIFVKKEVVLEHVQLENADRLNVLEPEVVKPELEKPSSHNNPVVESCIVGNDQEAVDSHSTDEQEAGKKLVVDEQEIDDAMFDKQDVMNMFATNDKDVYQNHDSVNKEVVVEHASLEDADMLNTLEPEVVKQEVDQPSSHNNPTVGEYSCIDGNRQQTGDSRLFDDQEAGKKLVFDGQEIDKDFLSDKQEATNSIVTNDAHVCQTYGLVKKEVVVEHATLKDADTLTALELEVGKQDVEIDKNFLSGKQESTNSIATNDEVVGQIHVSVKKEVAVEHALLEDADMLNTSNVAPPIKEDFADGGSEKLNLDRSSGDEFMEDILESKHMEPDIQFHESTDISKISKVDVKVVEQATDLETRKFSPETKEMEYGKPPAPVEKRKLEDTEVVGNNGAPKRQRRWNPDTIKVPEQQTTHFIDSMTPKNTEQPTVHRAFSRSNSILSEDSPKERIVPAPKRSATTSLRIDNFVRPFTLKAVQELLAKTGTIRDFWMDHIKTHCYVTYSSAEEATETRNAVYSLRWPPNGDRLLAAEFVDPREVKVRVEAPPQSPAPISPIQLTPKATPYPQSQAPQPSRQQSLRSQPHYSVPPLVQPPPPPPLLNPPAAREQLPPPPSKKAEPSVAAPLPLNPPPSIAKEQLPPPLQKAETPVVTLDDLFKKTKATPRIYYLPLSQEQVAAKLAAQAKKPQVQ